MVFETKFYNLLKVEPNATGEELKRAFDKMAADHHSDENASENERMKDIRLAFSTLADKRKREVYDQFGEKGLECLNRVDFDEEGYELRELGDVDGVRQIECKLSVTLDELFLGSTKIISIKASENCGECQALDNFCLKCNGEKTLNKIIKVNVNIPVGAPNNFKMIYDLKCAKGQGQPIKLTVLLRELQHPTLKRNGNHLTTELTINVIEALSFPGRCINTLNGRVLHIKYPQDCEEYSKTIGNGTTLVVKGEGMPHFDCQEKKGEMFITFFHIYPETLTDDQIEAVKSCLVPSFEGS